jgi:hypothetical protein
MMWPSRVLPPLLACFGTEPSQAENCRPFLNTRASQTVATAADAVSGPDANDGHEALRVGVMFDLRGNLRVTPRDLLVEGVDVMPACEERGACDTVELRGPVRQCLDDVVSERVDALCLDAHPS